MIMFVSIDFLLNYKTGILQAECGVSLMENGHKKIFSSRLFSWDRFN